MASIVGEQSKEQYRNAILDDLIGNKGIKTDVSVNLPTSTILKIIATVAGAVIIGTLSWFVIKKMMNKNK